MPNHTSKEIPSRNYIFVIAGCLLIFLLVFIFPLGARSSLLENILQHHTSDSPEAGLHLPVIFKEYPIPSPTLTPTLSTGWLLISEVMYNPLGDEPDGEWIELYNAGGATMDLHRYKVGDAAAPGDYEGMLKFPSGAIILPGQVIVIANRADTFFSIYGFKPDYEMKSTDPKVPDMIKYTSWSNRQVELTNGGDEVLILNGINAVVDALSWGSSTYAFDPPAQTVSEGYSLERYPPYRDRDIALDWRGQDSASPGMVDFTPPTNTPTPTPVPTNTPPITRTPTPTMSPTPFGGVLLLSEVMYHPNGSEPDGEWIEIYNAGSQVINLADFKLGDEETPLGGEGMLRFPANSTISASQVVVIAYAAKAFASTYGFNPDYEISGSEPLVPDMIPYTPWGTRNLQLSNTGDEVLLLDGNDQIVDSISYANSIIFMDPPIPGVPAGHSLERYPPDADTDTAMDWRERITPDPGNVDFTPPFPTQTMTPTRTSTPSPTPTMTPQPTPLVGRLLISEVFYDPPGVEPNNEWIELYNAGGSALDLSFIKVGDEETWHGEEGMMIFPLGASVDAGQVIVIANMATAFYANYGFNPDYEMVDTHPSIPDMVKYTEYASGNVDLGNDGDQLLILDQRDYLLDTLSWGNSVWAFDPPAPDVSEGHSLERVPPYQDTDTADDWIEQVVPNPGQVNSLISRLLFLIQPGG